MRATHGGSQRTRHKAHISEIVIVNDTVVQAADVVLRRALGAVFDCLDVISNADGFIIEIKAAVAKLIVLVDNPIAIGDATATICTCWANWSYPGLVDRRILDDSR